MKKRTKMSEEDIVAQLQQWSYQSIGAHQGQLSTDIEKANEYYYGKPYGDEIEGQSKFVSREVYEAVEGIMPSLIEIFFSSDMACVFEPEDEDDVGPAEQETEYANWVFYKKNPGFTIGYTWLKDGLLNKIGVVKCVREGCFKNKVCKYENLTDEQLMMLLSDYEADDLSDIKIERDEDEGTSDVTIATHSDEHKTAIYNIPPENFRISDDSKDIKTATYVGEEYQKTISELREMGFEVSDDISDTESMTRYGTVFQDRHEDVQDGFEGDTSGKGANREVTVHEEYVFLDVNGDGITELMKFIRVGDTILLQEEVEMRPYVAWGPIMIPHKFFGLSLADTVMDIQKLKSQFLRNILDNQFLANNGRYAVVDGQVNLDDLMTSAAHGIVRENFVGAVRELPTPQLGQDSFSVLGYVDGLAEKRTGISERSTGLDPRALNSNTAFGTTEMIMAAAEQKIRLIARVFAETGFKDLMLLIHAYGLKFEPAGIKMKTNNNQFIPLDPDSWRDRTDMTVTVGIGNGSKSMQMMQINQIMETQQRIVSGGGLGTLVTYSNIFNLAMEQSRVLGRKDGFKFYTPPKTDEVPPPQPSIDEQVKVLKAQTEQMKAKSDAELEQQKLELEAHRQILEEEKLQFEKEKLLFEEKKHEDDNQFRLLEAQLEAEQKRAVLIGKERGNE